MPSTNQEGQASRRCVFGRMISDEATIHEESLSTNLGNKYMDRHSLLSGYLDLADYSGRVIVQNKRGSIPENLPSILERLNLNPDTWMDELLGFKSVGFSAVGTVDQLKDFCCKVGKKFAVALRLKPALE